MNNPTTYTLKLANKTLQRVALISIPIFLFPLLFIDPPIDDFSFPQNIVLIARIVSGTSLIVAMSTVLIFLFYRNKKTVYLDDIGLQLPNYPFIFWERIQWYKINILSNKGIRRLTLKTNNIKIIIQAEDDQSFLSFTKDLKERIQLHNPIAKDFRELSSSKIKAFIYIIISIAVFLSLYLLLDTGKKIGLIFIVLLLVTIGAILIEHIKIPKKKN